MCGILFIDQKQDKISKSKFAKILESQKWRGPDNTSLKSLKENKILLGHNRLSILDKKSRSNQPMTSKDGRYLLIFNGEIYNYKEIAKKYKIKLKTLSDTEVLLNGFIKKGVNILKDLDGMFSFIIYDKKKDDWICARDRYGIKPLYIYQDNNKIIIGSEAGSIAKLLNLQLDKQSIQEWKLLRSPIKNYTFFKNLYTFPISSYRVKNSKKYYSYYKLQKKNNFTNINKIKKLISDSVKKHQMGHVKCTSLLSGGIDSSVILKKASKVKRSYSVGLKNNNEFYAANRIAKELKKKVKLISVNNNEIKKSWKFLTKLKGEPINVPNEGLIYLVCKMMSKKDKIVLTGEGADEIFFGYDKIFRWGLKQSKFNLKKFLNLYCYSDKIKPTKRIKNYINKLRKGKKVINFIEDFFYDFHLKVLLRRMDFASMAASKEARVPFVCKDIIDTMYRNDPKTKIDNIYSKKHLRKIINQFDLGFILDSKKIGFSAYIYKNKNKYYEYKVFQDIVLNTFMKEYNFRI